jgi:Lanthionine synthetase C-like protein
VGVVLISWKLAPTPAKAQRLFDLVEGNMHNASHELFDGAPGAMLAALHVYETAGDDRWRDLWQRCAEAVWAQFRVDPELGYRIWIQYRHGRLLRSVGAGHGFASNVRSLLRGASLLNVTRAAELKQAAAETARKLALEQDGLVNWPTAVDSYWAGQFPRRVQWCHGAPGLITSLWSLPREERLDDLLRGAGELVWKAGPLKKGAGLCHGTAGNRFAFLALHTRFGDEHWLDRAHAFASHAIEQLDRARPRHSLWTGDIGVALYLHACLEGFDGMPSFDTL